jgi:hypothetical protein
MSEDRDLSALYRSADKPQPPAALDAIIRDAAHKAVKPKRSHAPQWLGGIAASLIAALLLTQLLPTLEQEADTSTLPRNIPHPAEDFAAPDLELREAAPATVAPKPAPTESKTDRARTGNLIMQEKSGLKQSQAHKKATARDEADAIQSSETMEEADHGGLSTPAVVPASLQTELQAIADLLDAGRIREARQQLDHFLKRYPESEIPESLSRRLDSLDTE